MNIRRLLNTENLVRFGCHISQHYIQHDLFSTQRVDRLLCRDGVDMQTPKQKPYTVDREIFTVEIIRI